MLERKGCGGLVTAQACLTLNVAAAGMVGSATEINERFSVRKCLGRTHVPLKKELTPMDAAVVEESRCTCRLQREHEALHCIIRARCSLMS